MADTKITALTENTAPIATDILPMVDDPAGTPLTQKVSITNLFTAREIVAPTITTSIVPTTSDAVALGSSSSMFADLFLASGGVINFNNGDVTLTHAADKITIGGGDLVLAAGTTGIAPLKFTSGTNLTTAEAGAMEYDGKVLYASHQASSRGVNVATQFITLTSAYTIPTEGTALRAMFNSPANGALTVQSDTTYWFECTGSISSLSTTSGTLSFGIAGTAGTSAVQYMSLANRTAVTPNTASLTNVSATASTAITAAGTTATCQFTIRGILKVDTGGTIIPSIGHSVIANPIVGVGSTFLIYPIGTRTVQSVGNWS